MPQIVIDLTQEQLDRILSGLSYATAMEGTEANLADYIWIELRQLARNEAVAVAQKQAAASVPELGDRVTVEVK